MISKALISLALMTVANCGFLPEESSIAHPIDFHGLSDDSLAISGFPTHSNFPAQPVPIPNFQPVPVETPHYQPAPVASEAIIGIQKNILKTVQVPYPVDKYIKVDRQVPVPVTRYIRVDRPYEVIKYIKKPYIVKIEKIVNVPVVTKVKVPHPIVEVEPVFPEPQHIIKEISESIEPQSLPAPAPHPQSQYLPPPAPAPAPAPQLQSQHSPLPTHQSQSQYLPPSH